MPQGAATGLLLLLVVLGVAWRFFALVRPWAALVGGLAAVGLLCAGRWRGLERAYPVVLAGAGLAAAWFAARPPWGATASAVVWSGAVLIVTGIATGRRDEGKGATGVLFLVGLATGALIGWAAASASASPGILPLVLVVVAGRFAAWSLLGLAQGVWAGPLTLVAIALPSTLGVWGLLASLLEGIGMYVAARIDRTRAAWPYALGGLGVALGVYAGGLGV